MHGGIAYVDNVPVHAIRSRQLCENVAFGDRLWLPADAKKRPCRSPQMSGRIHACPSRPRRIGCLLPLSTLRRTMSMRDFNEVLAKIPYGVSVVTMGRGGAKVENGLTISWMSQVSFNPPMLMIAVDKLHYSVDLLRSTKNFCVNLLGADQTALAGRFAKQATNSDDKLAEVAQRPAESGAAILTDAVAYFDCEVASITEAGDHLVVIGKIEDAAVLNDRAPLTTASG